MHSKQPKGLSVLFLTEMWERFGFYIVQSLLVLYLTQQLNFSDARSYEILGAFTALAYIMPVIGGYIADTILGFRKAIIVGNILLIVGYAMMMFNFSAALYLSLAIIVMGTGFFKPNVSSMVGTLYEPNDNRRETGFTIFYIGINLGVFISTTSIGFVQQHYGWKICFLIAAIGLVLALTIFNYGRRFFNGQSATPVNQNHNKFFHWLRQPIGMLVLILVLIAIASLLIFHSGTADIVLSIASLLLLVMLYRRTRKYPRHVRYRLYALLILIASSIIFWAIYFQIFFSLNLFVERVVNRVVLGVELPPILFISVQSVALMILGFFVAKLWHVLAKRGKNPSTPLKFSLAKILLGVAFALIWLGTELAHGQQVNPAWIVLAYVIVALAELFLSAIGLSAVTVLAPADFVGFLMGIWFLALGWGGKIAGMFAKISAIPADITQVNMMSIYYGRAFLIYAIIAFAAGLFSLLWVPLIRKMIATESPTSVPFDER